MEFVPNFLKQNILKMKNPEFWLAVELRVLFLKTWLAKQPDAQSCYNWQLIIELYPFLQIGRILGGVKFYIFGSPEKIFYAAK